MDKFRHFRLSVDEHQILWLGIDACGKRHNRLDAEILDELITILGTLQQADHKGLIFHSPKPGKFTSGFDLELLQPRATTGLIADLLHQGRQACQLLASLPFPSLALIEGNCLGAGLELALAMDYRLAANTRLYLGFPEPYLGYHPCLGGTERWMAQQGPMAALPLLQGRRMEPEQALQLGLLTACLPPQQLHAAAVDLILHQPAAAGRGPYLMNLPFLRPLAAWRLARQLKPIFDPAHYPGPSHQLALWKKHAGNPQQLSVMTTRSASELLKTRTAANLIRLYLHTSRLLACSRLFPHPEAPVHIIGDTRPALELALQSARHGLPVSLQVRRDITAELVKLAAARLRLTRDHPHVTALLGNIRLDSEGKNLHQARLLLEASSDKAERRREKLVLLEQQAHKDAILACTVQELSLEWLSFEMLAPERLVGLHFFNPLPHQPLLEIILPSGQVPEGNRHPCCGFAARIGTIPLLLRDTPAHLVHRLTLTYILQGISFLQQGMPLKAIDRAGRSFGMPSGPLELADGIGLDECCRLAEAMEKAYRIRIPVLLYDLVRQGRLGEKSGQGFYRYRRGTRLKPDPEQGQQWEGDEKSLQEKLVNEMLEEASICLEEGICHEAELLDMGAVFGTGFPAFLGGPLQYSQQRNGQLNNRQTA
ncbi:MAG: enoyl-CoA hydratase/isomerase family protein [Thiothrix sp.]|nr:enoyl-CoA hydratase/isomerase family protein [Thiothrix sp.]HPE59127.1 enoyl-CoA hydratase-related protein [Thiolinea sp.]